MILARQLEEEVLANRREKFPSNKDWRTLALSFLQPVRLMPQQIEEKKAKGLCFNCDCKYSRGHKCVEKKLFYSEGTNDEEKD